MKTQEVLLTTLRQQIIMPCHKTIEPGIWNCNEMVQAAYLDHCNEVSA